MKRPATFLHVPPNVWAFALALITGASFVLPEAVLADVFASQIRITNPDGSEFDRDLSDGTGALISFILNDDASNVVVAIKEEGSATAIDEIELGAQSAGLVEVEWEGEGAADGTNYVVDVTAEQDTYSTEEWTVFFDSGDIDIFSRGGDAVTDMSSPFFGLIFVPNSGGPLGKGITIYHADGSFHDPFLVTPDLSSGGDIDWGSGSDSMFGGTLDDENRFYVSAVNHGEVRRLNDDFSLTSVVEGLLNPKGLWIDGTGEDRVLYVADDSLVVRAAIGTEDVFEEDVEVVGRFSEGYPRNIALDDDGHLYVSFRTSNDLASDPVSLGKFDISGSLPVEDADNVWSIDSDATYRISSLEIDRGSDLETAGDDILYFGTRGGSDTDADGIWRVDDLEAFFPTVSQVVNELQLYNNTSSNINDRAAITLDAAGNFVLLENSNEHVFFASPPGEGETSSFTTTSHEAFTVDVAVAIEDGEVPTAYRLEQNYPNPFNPTTTIEFTLGGADYTTVKVYDTLGRELRTLVAEHRSAGAHQVQWDGRDATGRELSSGVYILEVVSGSFRDAVTMTLAK